jgi:holo-[acyl-carrier protein] synthase
MDTVEKAHATLAARRVKSLRRLGRRSAAPRLRVGLDLVHVDDVATMLASRLASRYLARIYTRAEVQDCTDDLGVNAARLAGRFAAKEAVMKVLNVGDRAVPWRSIEIRRGKSGIPTIELHGAAAGIAGAEGISQFLVSVSHEAGYAAAVVVGTR